MNITEAARHIGISTQIASRLCRENHIAAYKGARGWEIPKSCVEEYITARRYERANDRMKKKMEKGQI